MVGFLVKRPVAVSMVFMALLILGLVAASYLPVSLVPDVDIPRVSVQVNAPEYSAREMEDRVMERLRMYLMQVNGLHDIKTESRDGSGLVSLEFAYGTSVDLAYIEVNEQVDKATANLPRNLARPAVVKASASDIPVFYLDIYLRQQGNHQGEEISEHDFLQLSAFADEIIRRRLEQIPQVAMADMSGRTFPEIIIKPDMEMLQAMGIQPETIESAIRANNVSLGNIMIRDKQYQYNVRVGSPLIQAEDIGNLWLNHEGRLWQLKELCAIESATRDVEGMVHSQGHRAVSMAIIKQADARMQELKKELDYMIDQFRTDYPHVEFTVYRDQTALLDYTINNLQQTLIIGSVLALLVMFLFLRDARSPWLIVISVPAALVVSLLFFFLTGMSLNIISLSGLILAVGMMIDNSIIVIDNISRYRQQGLNLTDACVKGTHEVFIPLLSSVLTTCSVFVPLIFLGGLPGALFFDQAMAVTIGLLVSLVIAITLVPVYYHMLFARSKPGQNIPSSANNKGFSYEKLYNRGFRFTMRNQGWVWLMFLGALLMVPLLSRHLPKEQLPAVKRDATLLWIDWNENIHTGENHRRVKQLLDAVDEERLHTTIQTGRQQFLMENLRNSSRRQSLIYIRCASPDKLTNIQQQVRQFMTAGYPHALFSFEEEGNLFDQVFAARQAPVEVRLRALQSDGSTQVANLQSAIQALDQVLPDYKAEPLPLQETFILQPNLEMMALHQVDMEVLHRALTRIFNENEIIALMDNQNTIPVKLGSASGADLMSKLHDARVPNRQNVEIPLSLLMRQTRGASLQTITAGLEGEYHPVEMEMSYNEFRDQRPTIESTLKEQGLFEATFSGSIFTRMELIGELLLIGSVALMLLFFILAAQFESLRLPVIVLLEVPITMAGALVMLWLFGATINIMSMIGLVVMSGIIINDSILKIDTINRLRADGMGLMRALHTAGHYRLKPILMTSITTIFALLPFLFTTGLGAELQKPLALAVIGGLGIGTVVSLYFVPLMYFYLHSSDDSKSSDE
jgi:multidrug efflux pump subunit AcrB